MCQLCARSVERWLRTFLAEYVNDPAARETLRRAQGFCAAHTRVLSTLGDALAIAILYADLARLTQERWQELALKRAPSSLWQRLRSPAIPAIAPPAPCPACVAQQEAETRYVRALADGLHPPDAQPQVWSALEAGSGLCAPHVELVAAHASPAIAARLLGLEQERLRALQAELETIVRKNDYRFRGEAWGKEKDAWKRALDKLRRD